MTECDTCDRDNIDWTTSIRLDFRGEVTLCEDCIAEDTTRAEANTTLLQREE